MIDWIAVAFSTSWILGLSILLSQFSIVRWEKSLENEGNPTPPHSKKARNIVKVIAYILVGVGFIGNSNSLWERLLWTLFTILFIGSMYFNVEEPQSD